MKQFITTIVCPLFILFLSANQNLSNARPFRPSQYPNGTILGCAACHINPAGGGPRTPFGEDVYVIIGGSPNAVPFWTPALAARDSDGDTYCNGQEVGDPDGDGIPVQDAVVTNSRRCIKQTCEYETFSNVYSGNSGYYGIVVYLSD
ncbi:MAG: hypothetical protein ACPMAG_14805 [Limisphaerales bacterium]|jgi:hypothetical protein